MWDVARNLQQETPPEAKSVDDKLSWTMIFIRAAQTLNIRRMERAAAAYPYITTFVQARDPNARIHPNFRELRNHARDLAHQQLTDELLQLNRSDDQECDTHQRKKQQLIARLSRLMPGATHNIGAILTDDDDLATTPISIANALKKHWEPIFQQTTVNTQLLHDWIDSTTNFHDKILHSQASRNLTTSTQSMASSPSTSRSTSPTSSIEPHSSPTSNTNNHRRARDTTAPAAFHPTTTTPTNDNPQTRPEPTTTDHASQPPKTTGRYDAKTSLKQSKCLASLHQDQTVYPTSHGDALAI